MSSEERQFAVAFEALTGWAPMPWQAALYKQFAAGDFSHALSLPTGLGKTTVIHIWLLALAAKPDLVPRRLVYVVNRRTIVDQATREAENLRENLVKIPSVNDGLRALCATNADPPLAISTLRGQFADNGEWCCDPARPAIVVGTVDMIGSRLLFSGYGLGFRRRPLHAGFLGQDALLVHDEAHLEPAFQRLLESIVEEQKRCRDFRTFHVTPLTATPRGDEKPFGLGDEERNPPEVIPNLPTEPIHHVWRRLTAKKSLTFYPLTTQEKPADRIAELALRQKDSGRAIMVFVRRLEDVEAVRRKLGKQKVQLLTGTLRGLERDQLATKDQVFARFLPPPKRDDKREVIPAEGTVYLICTSAGEVGVDISADHLVCDLTPFESMAQRFGRVNRYGSGDAQIDVVHEAEPNGKKADDPYEQARWRTRQVLQRLPKLANGAYDASPRALMELPAAERIAAFSPPPTILSATDILFDAWALTTIREKLPGRPPVEPYLHGIREWDLPETYVAWREEVRLITGDLLNRYPPADLLEDYPLKPHELLRDRSDRVFDQLESLAKKHPDSPVWLMDGTGNVEPMTLAELVNENRKDRINYATLLLPPDAGGLQDGQLNGDSETANDVADEWFDEKGRHRRVRVWNCDFDFKEQTAGMRLIREPIDVNPDSDDGGTDEEWVARRLWFWYELPYSADGEGSRTSGEDVLWEDHARDVMFAAGRIAEALHLPDEIREAVQLAAEFHDLGKKRDVWQRSIGNRDLTRPLAKSGRRGKPIGLNDYRHEFGSLLDVEQDPHFRKLSEDMRDLVLHLIAAHHGRARPHFPADEAFDPDRREAEAARVAIESPRRFARLQRRFGRWGLAYLESLLRAADYAASAGWSSGEGIR